MGPAGTASAAGPSGAAGAIPVDPSTIADIFSKGTILGYLAQIRRIQQSRIDTPLIKNIFEDLIKIGKAPPGDIKKQNIAALELFYKTNKAAIDNEYLKFATEAPHLKNIKAYLDSIRNFFFQNPQGGKGLSRKHQSVKYRKY